MRIELRILSGARAGQSEVFEKSAIRIGRKPTNDLKFDTFSDLDVSGDHAEIRELGGQWFVVDNGSTNGTFVNGAPVRDESVIKDGDIIAFGKNGPTVEVRAKGDATGKTPAVPRTEPRRSVKVSAPAVTMAETPRISTHERVAVAVREQTRGMKTMLWGSMIGLGALAVAAYWFGSLEGGRQVAEMQRSLAQAESISAELSKKLSTGGTELQLAFKQQLDSLRNEAAKAADNGSEQEIATMKQRLEQHTLLQQGLVAMNMPAINAQNGAAVAFLITELDGVLLGGTAFAVTKDGLLVTNRHNVKSTATGAMTTRLEVQFPGKAERFDAKVLKVNDEDDLALIQIARPGNYPTVAGISAKGNVVVGASLAMIGYPLSLSLPMEGNTVSTSLSAGIASRRIPSLLQIEAMGAHGMSGSPVFDASGLVVGVVYGGPKDLPSIIYSVPSDRLAAFLGDAGKGIVR
jgi:pSer/pThr/pTyr-binding forkhead associated (FHA) protein/S1-C subfamily serine protease